MFQKKQEVLIHAYVGRQIPPPYMRLQFSSDVMRDVVQSIAQLIADETEYPVEVSGDLTIQIHPQR
jgi:hypothetical protein